MMVKGSPTLNLNHLAIEKHLCLEFLYVSNYELTVYFGHLDLCLFTDFLNSLDQSLKSSPPCCWIHHNAEELAILTWSIIDHETSRDQFLRDSLCGL
jgi:hypothetical protein